MEDYIIILHAIKNLRIKNNIKLKNLKNKEKRKFFSFTCTVIPGLGMTNWQFCKKGGG